MDKLRQAARQALAQLEINRTNFRKGPSKSICKMLAGGNDEIITALRTALAEQPAERRPQNCGTGFCSCIECPYEQPAEHEPVAWMHTNAIGHVYFRKNPQDKTLNPVPLYTSPPAQQQEPVAWMWKDGTLTSDPDRADGTWTPLYTAPQPRPEVELTDEEIDALPWGPSYDNPMTLTEGLREFARAVIEAYKAKQGEQI